ncbi:MULTISPECIES: ester cyclase [Sulfurimonas]|uniref:Ester cyclase n=1 Tax=Sulfurimonas diazotrophicus TaxID=3131939 RepID=A0ABZ3HD12_9BACT
MMEPRQLLERYYAMWNDKDFSQADVLLDPDVRFRGSLGIEANGLAGFKDYAELVTRAFPALYHAVEITVVENERAAAYVSYTGKHEGELFGHPASGNRVSFSGASFFHFRNGKIASINVLGDLNTLLSQLS